MDDYSSGILTALSAKGHQDTYMEASSKLFDCHQKDYMKGTYQTMYKILDTEQKLVKSKLTNNFQLEFNIKRTCDFINMVDIAIHNPDNLSIHELITSVTVEIGGQRMDRMGVTPDIETQIRTNAAIFNRVVTTVNGTTFIPLTMAPLHEHNLISPSALKYHDVKIIVELNEKFVNSPVSKGGVGKSNTAHSFFTGGKYSSVYSEVDELEEIEQGTQSENRKKDAIMKKIVLYGNVYYLDDPERKILYENSDEFITIQNQYTGSEKLKKGVNTIKLHYNHPVYMMYFWGFDKTKVKNVKLTLEGHSMYDGPIEPLEHHKNQRGLGHVEPTFIFFSPDKFNVPTGSSVNFSRMDYPRLMIETEEEDADIHIVGLNMQPLRMMSGMAGLAFSK